MLGVFLRMSSIRVESDDIPEEGIGPQLDKRKKICCRTKKVNILSLPFSCINEVEIKTESTVD